MAHQPPEGRRIGGPAATDDMDGNARLGQQVADRPAAAQGADVQSRIRLRGSPRASRHSCWAVPRAVERVDDVQDALFHVGVPEAAAPG